MVIALSREGLARDCAQVARRAERTSQGYRTGEGPHDNHQHYGQDRHGEQP